MIFESQVHVYMDNITLGNLFYITLTGSCFELKRVKLKHLARTTQ